MRLINAADLTFTSDAELKAMIQEVLESLEYMNPTNREYAATVDSLLVLNRALAARKMSGPKF